MPLDRIIVPIPENLRIGRTSVLISDSINSLVIIIINSSSDTISGKSSINLLRLDFNLEHEFIADFSLVDIVAVAVTDPHGAGGRGPGVGDGARRGQGRDIEPDVEVLLAGVVHAADAVSLGFVRHEFGMLLDHEDEFGFTLLNDIEKL